MENMMKKNWWKFCLMALLLILSPPEAMAQSFTIKGQVVDNNGESIIGASVVEKGNATNGTITDFDGNFELKLSGKGKTLVISYVGYQTEEVAAVAGKDLKIVMKDDAQAMEEVVVIGYTSRARKDLTGSVGSVSGVKIAAVPVASAAEALQGKIAGVQVTTVDGAPGADINMPRQLSPETSFTMKTGKPMTAATLTGKAHRKNGTPPRKPPPTRW